MLFSILVVHAYIIEEDQTKFLRKSWRILFMMLKVEKLLVKPKGNDQEFTMAFINSNGPLL